jgi:hypothetical protein
MKDWKPGTIRTQTIGATQRPSMTVKDHLIIFDTTLRDGEQSPGASMTRDEKVRIAKALERMRVDVIEAGFPSRVRATSKRSRRSPRR